MYDYLAAPLQDGTPFPTAPELASLFPPDVPSNPRWAERLGHLEYRSSTKRVRWP